MVNLGTEFLKLDNPIDKGAVSEFIAQLYFKLRGWVAYKPTSESGRVDYLIENSNGFCKVQVKTVYYREKDGKYKIDLKKRGKNGKLLLYGPEELDLLIAYSPHFNAILEIPGDLAWDKHDLTFSTKDQGNYCGTSRFIEDYITLQL